MEKPTRRIIPKPPQKINRVLTLPEFYATRNKILIVRGVGGLGDILMHRMMFEDFKTLDPTSEIHFACPAIYHEALKDHPFIDKLIDSNSVDRSEYIVNYNTSTACGRYEGQLGPKNELHRSDIWSLHCGVRLKNHNMHIQMTTQEQDWARSFLKEQFGSKPIVLIAPISAMETKNLLPHQLEALVKGLELRGHTPVGLHNNPMPWFDKNGVPSIFGRSTRQWMSLIHAADYIVSVDSAAFHCAGGMGKPLTGIYTWANGKVYGKYFDFVLCQLHRDTHPEWTCGPCYNWCDCPKTKLKPKPCLTELTTHMILASVDKMLEKWPKSLI